METNDAAEQAAVTAAEKWFLLVDVGDAAESWNQTSSLFKSGFQSPVLFRAGISAQQWQSSLAAMRIEPRRAASRTLRSARYAAELLGEPQGEYVTLEYATAFACQNPTEGVVL